MSKSFLLGTTGIAPFYPAITPNYAKFAVNHSNPLRNGWWPNGLTARSFNPFWKFDSQFEYPNALLSGGVVLGKDQKTAPKPMLTDLDKRDAMWTSLLLDSGGYSIPRGSMRFHGDHTRREINDYCLKSGANGIMTLDIPPRKFNRQFPDFQACLNTTIENLWFIVRNTPTNMLPLYLCVLQGETVDQIRAWYNAVKAFPFRNWAFAGTQYKRIAILLEQLAIMLQEGMLDDTIWIHNLGVEKLSLTCAYTTIQETLTELLGHPVKVSYDSASPFNEVNEHHKCFKAYNLTKRGFSLSTGQVPDSPRFIGSDMPFPYQSISAISKGLTLGHLCVNPKPQKGSTWDQLSCMILQNHNLDVVISGIIAAHSRYQLPRDEALQVCPTWLVHAKEGIRRVLFSETPMTVINQYRSAFDMLSKQVDALADEFR